MRRVLLATTLLAGTALAGTAFGQAQQPGEMPGAGTDVHAQPGAAGEGMQAGAGMDQYPQLSFQGEHVRIIEQALSDHGQDIQADDQWGPESQQALQSFQQEQGLDATGDLSFETLAALNVDFQQLAEAEAGADAPQAAETPEEGAVGQPSDQMETAPGAPSGQQ